jgi:hypothetical protein
LNPFRFVSCGPLSCRFVQLLNILRKLVRGGVRGLSLVGCWEDREGGLLRYLLFYMFIYVYVSI